MMNLKLEKLLEVDYTIKVMCADQDVFLLLVYAYEKHKLSCSLIVEDPVAGRTMYDIKASAIKKLRPNRPICPCTCVNRM